MNDFDEAAIFDFRIDVWRVAVSIWNHALSNGLGDAAAEASVLTFVDGYIAAVQGYVGNDDALLWEATRETTTGRLQKFLKKVAKKDSQAKQLVSFKTPESHSSENPSRRLRRVNSGKKNLRRGESAS